MVGIMALAPAAQAQLQMSTSPRDPAPIRRTGAASWIPERRPPAFSTRKAWAKMSPFVGTNSGNLAQSLHPLATTCKRSGSRTSMVQPNGSDVCRVWIASSRARNRSETLVSGVW